MTDPRMLSPHRPDPARCIGCSPAVARLFGLGLVGACAGLTLPSAAFAQPSPGGSARTLSVSGSVTGNVGLVSDYRFRGVSRTFGDPALQAGVDFALPSRFYVGAWTSMVDKEIFANTRGFEVDVYGGYRHDLGRGLMLDVGLQQYLMPSKSRYSTFEAYAGVTWEWLSFKYSHGLSNRYFGVDNARNSQYFDLKGAFPFGNGWHLVAHYGVQRIAHNSGDYTDYSVGVTKDWKGLTWSANLVDTDSTFSFTNRAGRTRNLGDRAIVLGVAKAF